MVAAVDIGGTKTLVAVFDNDGKIIEQQKIPTAQDYDKFIAEVSDTVAKLSTKEFDSFAVAAPGKIDRQNGIAVQSHNVAWHKAPLVADLEKVFNAPGVIENDAKAAALSEAHLLDKKYGKVLYVTVSTGIGCGLIIDGKLDPKFWDIEIGNMLLEHNGRLMRWEDFASGKAIVAKFGKKASEISDSRDWYIIARNIAIGLIDAIASLTPDIIIFGGGVGAHFEKYEERLLEELHIYENPVLTIPPIVKAKHPEEAVVYGCYELAKEHYGHSSK